MSELRDNEASERSDGFEQRWIWNPYASLIKRGVPIPFVITLLLSLFAIAGLFQEKAARFAGIKTLEAKDERTRQAERLQKDVAKSFGLQRPDLFLIFEIDREATREDIRAMRRAVEALRRLPYVAQALWIDDVPAVNLFQLTRSILPADTISPEGFAEEMQKIVEHPLAHGQLVANDGRSYLVALQLDWLAVTSDHDVRDGLLAVSREAIALVEQSQLRVEATGDVPLYLDQLQAHRRNQSRFQWIGYSIVLVVASLIYRSPLPVILVAVAPATGIFWATATMRWLGEPANPLSDSVLPVLVAIVGVTDGVHLLAHYRDGIARGLSPRLAAAHAVEEVAQACFLTSLTTAIGFMSLLWADSELIRGFGRSCAIGVSLAFIALLTVFPWIASWNWLGRRVPGAHILNTGSSWLARMLAPTYRRYRLVATIGVLLTAWLGTSLYSLKGDDKRAYGLPSGSPAFQTLQRVDRGFGGIESGQVLVTWQPEWDQTPALLEAIDHVDQALQAEAELGKSLSIAMLGKTMTMAPGSAPFDFVALIPSVLRGSLYQPEQRQAVVSFRLKDLGVADLDPVFARLETQLESIERQYPGIELGLTGDGVIRGRRVVRVIEDLKWSLLGAGIVIFSLLAVVLKSLKLGLIAIIPNLFPISVSAALLSLSDRHLDISAACALTVCLGIAVDDTIHFLTRYQRERRSGYATSRAIARSIEKVGLSLGATTLIMTIGFATVLLSEMPAQRIFGAMSVCTITAALVADLILLPALLLLFDRQASASTTPQDSMNSEVV